MVVADRKHATRPVRGASSAAGVAVQYRVQYYSPLDHTWRLYASYARLELARLCVVRLLECGVEARVVHYGCCPTGT